MLTFSRSGLRRTGIAGEEFTVAFPSMSVRAPVRLRRLVLGIAYAASLVASATGTRLGATPLPRTILFIDDADVLYRPGTKKRVVPMKKYSTDPVITPDRPWEGMIGWT